MALLNLFRSLSCASCLEKNKDRRRRTSIKKSNTIMSDHTESVHNVCLSLLDQGMPRHYLRFCLTYGLGDSSAQEAIAKLRVYFRRIFQEKPWLAGYASPVRGDCKPAHQLEISFTYRDVENFKINVQDLTDTFPYTYAELCNQGMPPSKIPRELLSECPPFRPDTGRGIIIDLTVNIIRGGLLVAIYLHHGVTDGATMGTIIGGELCSHIKDPPILSPKSMSRVAHSESLAREPLSRICRDQSIGNHDEYQSAFLARGLPKVKPLGPSPTQDEVTSHIFFFPDSRLQLLKTTLNALVHASSSPEIPWVTTHDALHSLLWQHLTRARVSSLQARTPKLPEKSTLLIPVNMRKRISPSLPASFLGGCVALAPARVNISSLLGPPSSAQHLGTPTQKLVSAAYLLNTCVQIHTAITRCNDTYMREVLALTAQQASCRNMADLNLDTTSGLDLCITSWAVLPVFGPVVGREGCRGGDMGMGLGLPDFLRKPWSRDAGGCIILPRDERRSDAGNNEGGLEVLVQLRTEDMGRLVADGEFMANVGRVID